LQLRRAQVNTQINTARAQVLAALPAGAQREALLAQLEGSRAQANSQIDRASALCP
jgi:hypothetical protein